MRAPVCDSAHLILCTLTLAFSLFQIVYKRSSLCVCTYPYVEVPCVHSVCIDYAVSENALHAARTTAVENQEQVEQIMLHVSQREPKILLVVVCPCVPASVCLSLSLYISRYCELLWCLVAERLLLVAWSAMRLRLGSENMKYLIASDRQRTTYSIRPPAPPLLISSRARNPCFHLPAVGFSKIEDSPQHLHASFYDTTFRSCVFGGIKSGIYVSSSATSSIALPTVDYLDTASCIYIAAQQSSK